MLQCPECDTSRTTHVREVFEWGRVWFWPFGLWRFHAGDVVMCLGCSKMYDVGPEGSKRIGKRPAPTSSKPDLSVVGREEPDPVREREYLRHLETMTGSTPRPEP